MSPSDLLRATGLHVSTRQFRRYMASGIIPGVRRGKRGRFVVVGPVTPRRIARTNELIRKFRCAPGRKKLRYVPPAKADKRSLSEIRFRRLNLAGILIEFGWWMNQCEPLKAWTTTKKREVLHELTPALAVGLRLSRELKQALPEWDGTKEQFRRLAW